MNSCTDVLLITTLACQIAECLTDNELAQLAADTLLLSDALNAIAVRRTIAVACKEQIANASTTTTSTTTTSTSTTASVSTTVFN